MSGRDIARCPVYVADSPGKGRGLFAADRAVAGTVLEVGQVLVLPASEREVIGGSTIADYTFEWDDGRLALVLSAFSLANHSSEPNMDTEFPPDKQEIWFVALRDINAGEELTHNYNGDPEDGSPTWFEAAP